MYVGIRVLLMQCRPWPVDEGSVQAWRQIRVIFLHHIMWMTSYASIMTQIMYWTNWMGMCHWNQGHLRAPICIWAWSLNACNYIMASGLGPWMHLIMSQKQSESVRSMLPDTWVSSIDCQRRQIIHLRMLISSNWFCPWYWDQKRRLITSPW